MADLSITAASVVAQTGAIIENGTAGTTITAGQTVYLDTATSTYKLADTDLSAAASVLRGVALHASLSGQPLAICTGGSINLGATLTVGLLYVLSATAGGVCPIADLTTGAYPNILGFATTASLLTINIQRAGVVKP